MAREIFKCQCGQRLTHPIPSQCPKCGAKFLGVRKSRSLLVLNLISIVAMIGVLLLLIFFLVKLQS